MKFPSGLSGDCSSLSQWQSYRSRDNWCSIIWWVDIYDSFQLPAIFHCQVRLLLVWEFDWSTTSWFCFCYGRQHIFRSLTFLIFNYRSGIFWRDKNRKKFTFCCSIFGSWKNLVGKLYQRSRFHKLYVKINDRIMIFWIWSDIFCIWGNMFLIYDFTLCLYLFSYV